MNDTFIPRSDYTTKKWYILDAKQKPVGRVATVVSTMLQGKHKVDYHPAVDVGDYIIIINAKDIIFNTLTVRYHVYSPGRPGRSLKKVVNSTPQRIIESAVKNMLPNGLRSIIPSRLHIYESAEHPHVAQNPIKLQ